MSRIIFERLAAIRARLDGVTKQSPRVYRDCVELLAEVDRLRKLRGIEPIYPDWLIIP